MKADELKHIIKNKLFNKINKTDEYNTLSETQKKEIKNQLADHIDIICKHNCITPQRAYWLCSQISTEYIQTYFGESLIIQKKNMENIKKNLTNAITDTPYEYNLNNLTENNQPINIQKIDFHHTDELCFDSVKNTIYGVLTKPGDIKIEITYSYRDNHPKYLYKHEVNLLVISNPNSLWQNKDPDINSKFFKLNHESAHLSFENHIDLYAASIRGRSHAHIGSFRDDDFFVSNINSWRILVVADGAGSAKYSREGSRIAVNIVGEFLKDTLRTDHGENIEKILYDGCVSPHDILKNPIFTKLSDVFFYACKETITQIEAKAIENNANFRDFSTTLLAAVAIPFNDKLFISSFAIGDGIIATYSTDGNVKQLNKPDSGEYAGQTLFLDWHSLQHEVFKGRATICVVPQDEALILMTDGISDPYFETDAGLKDSSRWEKLMADVNNCLIDEKPAEKLKEWLQFPSTGHHDDRTIVILKKSDKNDENFNKTNAIKIDESDDESALKVIYSENKLDNLTPNQPQTYNKSLADEKNALLSEFNSEESNVADSEQNNAESIRELNND